MIDERFVHKTVAAWGWIDAAEVPVAQMVGAGIVQALKALEHKLHAQEDPQYANTQYPLDMQRNALYAEAVIHLT